MSGAGLGEARRGHAGAWHPVKPKKWRSWDHSTTSPANSRVHTSPTRPGRDFIAHLEQLDPIYAPKRGLPIKPVVLVEDNGRVQGAGSRAKHSPPARIGSPSSGCPNTHRNGSGIELVWRDLKAHHLAHQTFLDATALDTAIHDAVRNLNRERMPDPLAKLRSSA